MPDDVKQPQDHKKKADEDLFSFEYDGDTFTFPVAPRKILTSGWIRKRRHLEETDMFYTLLEAMADDEETNEALVATDKMTIPELNDLQEKFQAFQKVSLGESGASSTS